MEKLGEFQIYGLLIVCVNDSFLVLTNAPW